MLRACMLATLCSLAAGCVVGRQGSFSRDGAVSAPDASVRRDGSVDGHDGSSARDGSSPSDGSTTRDGSSRRDASWLPDGALPPFEAICDDGIDADGDDLTDCQDPDCNGAICDSAGSTCTDFVCGGCRGEPSETMCGDGVDDDCDGATDCLDSDCAGVVCGLGGVVCAGGSCPCASGFTERNCADSTDDDCDGLTDCADPDCDGRACAGGGMICTSGTCTCSPSAEFCNDRDEDCDGVIDDGCPRALSLCCPSSGGTFGGGLFGTAFSDACPSGTMLMGVAGRASTRVDALQPICAALIVETDRTTLPEWSYPVRRGAPILGAVHGGTGGTAFDDRCPGNDVVIGVRGAVDELGNSVTSISLQCGTVAVSRHLLSWRRTITPSVTTPSRGAAGSTPFGADCADGAVTTVAGRASTTVTSVSVTCQRIDLETL